MNKTSLAQQRANMVEGQLRPHKVNQKPILARFSNVPREDFVTSAETAYLDQPVAIAPGREVFSPLVAARLIQALEVSSTDSVLVVAAGTGYTSTILAPLCSKLVAVEDDATLAKQADANFAASALANVTLEIDNPTHGYLSGAPYQAILVDAPFAELHGPLVDQLAEGGRLAGVRIGTDGIPEATVFTKHGNTLMAEVLFETKGTVHPAFMVSEKFVF
jgi:protein-L-isoaspartate(D-aspartate) O-methyltransferase